MPNLPKHKRTICPDCKEREIVTYKAERCNACRLRKLRQSATAGRADLGEALHAALKKPAPVEALAQKVGATPGQTLDALLALQARGVNVQKFGELWSLEKAPALGSLSATGAYVSRKGGRYRFGWLSDTHLCSKYARLDVLRDIYRRFADRDLDRILHAGNWIDGEARFNKHDLLVHGMDAQIRYLRDEYPVAPNGLTTYSVAGDDHEGWYGQREGVDIGRYAERELRDGGRTDWVNLGYMEAFLPLQHAETGKTAQLHLVHPGGGSAYATSYTVQKLVESYSGGSKPAVLLAGHYHKLEYLNTRNVHCIQTGCTQDQTPFARKKRLHFALGGGTCELEQDPDTGAIVGCVVEVWNYFDAGYYVNDRFSYSGGIALPPVTRGGAGKAVA
jgi:predicted phosphodiesterase